MKIGIDVTLFAEEHFTGISRCVDEVLKVWIKEKKDAEFYLFFCNKRPINIKRDWPENWHLIGTDAPFNKTKLWKLFVLPKEIKKYKIDIFWGPNYYIPNKIKDVRMFVSVYDLAMFRIHGISKASTLIKHKLFLKKNCKDSDKIITISEATARDIEEIFGINPGKIGISYCGIDKNVSQRKIEEAEIRDELRIDSPFFLFIGTIEPRKNIETIIKAFDYYRKKYKTEAKLVLAGGKGWNDEGIYQVLENSRNKKDILLPGYISDEERAYLLDNCEGFLYPSLYEGFGLPILEAFKFGKPVVTASVSSMPEVGGDAAFYVENPKDYKGIAGYMDRIIHSSDSELEELKNNMKNQLDRFSWEKNAEEIWNMITKE